MSPNTGRRPDPAGALFDAGSEVGRALAAVEWSRTPLGPVEQWPASLRNTVRLMLGSRFAMWMAWGPELTFLCNDAYRRDTLGAKFPWALGRRSDEVWSEVWSAVRSRIESVVNDGASTWDEDLLLFLERSGYQEETYHTFSYSPLADDDGGVVGMICVVSEDTAKVVGERRLATVRDLATALAGASTLPEVFAACSRQLAEDDNNLPFAAGYLFSDDETRADLMWAAGIPAGSPVTPRSMPAAAHEAIWPVGELAGGQATVLDLEPPLRAVLPTGAWDEPPTRALAVPFDQPGERRPSGFLVVGLNRYRPLDDAYRGFLELIAQQIGAAIARARAFDEERRRAAELAELDRAKTTFFTNVSHELRTPLTLLLGPAEDALADTAEPLDTVQRRRIEIVQRNGERLLKLVNTLLDFSRLAAGRNNGRFEPVDLARYTAELAGMFDSAMRRAGLDFTVTADDVAEPVYVDVEMWAKIVLNLLSNALKATFTGSIDVHVAGAGDGVELRVADTGTGIPTDEQGRLFDRFHRVSGASSRSHEGSGIGLALVAELAAAHGGSVGVTSTLGVGTTFTVRVPYGHDHLPDEQVVLATLGELPAVHALGAGYLAEADRWLEPSTDAEPAGAPTSRPTVLVVDDNADMRRYISELLSAAYDVRTAVDGVEALADIHEAVPDLVLTDVMMPNLDGFGLLTALRADPATMHVPVIMLSARSGDDATVEGLDAGADDYLVKPFSTRELLARVRANLELDRVRRLADALERSRTMLDQAEQLAHVGSWQLDLATGAVSGSTEFFEILGASDPNDASGQQVAQLLTRVHPEDLSLVEQALDRLSRSGDAVDLEVRVRAEDGPRGRERLVRVHGVRLASTSDDSAAGQLARGSVQDITEQRSAERAETAAAVAREAAAREHEIADQLQRTLLPDAIFDARELDIATYYRAGVEGTSAGGDWYDVIDLGDGRTALVLGDVMGRGVPAAAVMGQLRATVRAYARLDLAPDHILTLLDRAVRELSEKMIVTFVYAVHDPLAGSLTYCNAGHLPPLLTLPGSTPRRLTDGSPPLGASRQPSGSVTVDFPPDAQLALYTDGLVERRDSTIDAGIDRLAEALSRRPGPLEAVPGWLADSLLAAEPDDDVAILVARRTESSDRRWHIAVPVNAQPVGASISRARRAAAAVLAEWGVHPDIVWDLLLAASELITNAVRHGAPPVELRLRSAHDGIVLEVHDGSSEVPVPRAADPDAPNGRGLHLVDAMSRATGVRPTGNGKAVWCLLPTHPNGGSDEPPHPMAGEAT